MNREVFFLFVSPIRKVSMRFKLVFLLAAIRAVTFSALPAWTHHSHAPKLRRRKSAGSARSKGINNGDPAAA